MMIEDVDNQVLFRLRCLYLVRITTKVVKKQFLHCSNQFHHSYRHVLDDSSIFQNDKHKHEARTQTIIGTMEQTSDY